MSWSAARRRSACACKKAATRARSTEACSSSAAGRGRPARARPADPAAVPPAPADGAARGRLAGCRWWSRRPASTSGAAATRCSWRWATRLPGGLRDRGRRRRLRRPVAAARAPLPCAADAGSRTRRAGLYNMTPDAHPIVGRIGDGATRSCGSRARVHAVARSRPRPRRGNSPRPVVLRPRAVPALALRGRARIPQTLVL